MLFAFQFFAILVALLHFYFLVLEMFLWTKPKGLKVFNMTEEQALQTKILAKNQGLYNGFLGIGILYGLHTQDLQVTALFLSFVVAAGVYGAFTASFKIIYVQALPALIAIILGNLL